jgi:hypothetical protein
MKVNDKITTSEIHSIEWGKSTWNSKSESIRNRYDNAEGDKFNYAASAEIPWEDFKLMIKGSIERDHFNNEELSELLNEISLKL